MVGSMSTRLSKALLNAPPKGVTFPWAYVVTTNPMSVRFPGGGDPIAVTANATTGAEAGDRVFCVWADTSLTVVANPDAERRAAALVPELQASVDALPRVEWGYHEGGTYTGTGTSEYWDYKFRRPYTTTPAVSVNISHFAGGSLPLFARATHITRDGFRIIFSMRNGAALTNMSLNATWMAVG